MLLMDARSADATNLRPTLGPYVCAWIETHCRHGSSDLLGRHVQLTADEVAFIWRLYELTDDGTRIVRRALLGLPKGSRKTELAAWLALAELAGPVRFLRWHTLEPGRRIPVPMAVVDPEVIVFANSRAQAKRIQTRAGNIVSASPSLSGLLKVEQQGISFLDGTRPGRLVAIAAEAKTADGYTPSAAFGDEAHDMVQGRKALHGKIRRGIPKRPDSYLLDITTAGDPHIDSVGRDLWERFQRLTAAPDASGRWLAWWRTADAETIAVAARELPSVTDPNVSAEVLAERVAVADEILAARAAAVRQANPEPWKDHEAILDELEDASWSTWARYYLNAWVTQTVDAFIDLPTWAGRRDLERLVEPGEPVVLGFDGSRNRDSTAIVGCTLAGKHLFTVRVWEAEPGNPTWTVPRAEVMHVLRDAIERYDTRAVWYDPWGWAGELEELAREFRGVEILPNPMTPERHGPQVAGFWAAVHDPDGDLTHDGSEVLTRHLSHALMRSTRHGAYLEKRGGKDSTHWIDSAVAAIYALDAAIKLGRRHTVGPQIFFPGSDT